MTPDDAINLIVQAFAVGIALGVMAQLSKGTRS